MTDSCVGAIPSHFNQNVAWFPDVLNVLTCTSMARPVATSLEGLQTIDVFDRVVPRAEYTSSTLQVQVPVRCNQAEEEPKVKKECVHRLIPWVQNMANRDGLSSWH